MKQKDFTGIVPQQYTGKEIEATASKDLTGEAEAKRFYSVVKDRLLQVNNWHKVAGLVSARFELIDATGKEANRSAEKGDYVKIDIPGPGSNAGDGYDWVCIEELKEVAQDEVESTGFRVRPAKNPNGDKDDIAHFYSGEATSNFIVMREKTRVSALIVDRNLKPNDETDSITDKLRHTTVGMSAINGFSKIQWQNLADGLVADEK